MSLEAPLLPRMLWKQDDPPLATAVPPELIGLSPEELVADAIAQMEANQQGDKPSEYLQMLWVVQEKGIASTLITDLLPIFEGKYDNPRNTLAQRLYRLNEHYLEPRGIHLGRDLDELPYGISEIS